MWFFGEVGWFTDVVPLNGRLGSLEPKTNVLVPSASALPDAALRGAGLAGEEDVGLFLERALRLDGEFGGHFDRLLGGEGCWVGGRGEDRVG